MIESKDLIEGYLEKNDWRVNENANVNYSLGGLILHNSGALVADYWLNEVYPKDIAKAHRNGDMHIHDLGMLSGYCQGWSLKQIIQEGVGGVQEKVASKPAKHLSTLVNQIVNFLGIMQNEWAGAQAFSSFDTYLAPFVWVDNLNYEEVKQCIQNFVFGVNTPSRWGCVDEETEVLSVGGFKKYNELKKGDLIYTWNNGKLEINKVNEVFIKEYKGEMHSYKVGKYNQTVSPEHRVLTKNFNENKYKIRKSEDIIDAKTAYSLPSRFNKGIKNTKILEDCEIQLASIVYCDGSLDFRKDKIHKVRIYKSPNRYGNKLIKNILSKLNLEYTLKEVKGDFDTILNQYTLYGDSARYIQLLVGQKNKVHKFFETLSTKQSKIFIDTWAKFDGCKNHFKLQYDNENIKDSLQHIALRSGYTSYIVSRNKTNYVKIRKNKNVQPKIREKFYYEGIVWCPSVNNGTAIFRKDNNTYISGQSQAPFTNITLDWICPKDLENINVIIDGEEQEWTYSEFQDEMDMINKAFIEIMLEGDANGRSFAYPIPTYNITKSFDWNSNNANLLFQMTAKYGTPYFQNFINSDLNPEDVRSMCCRLRLDKRELRKRGGGLFGSDEFTGSLGVVTINLPRIGYFAENEEQFFEDLTTIMDLAAKSLLIKRGTIEKLYKNGLFPYTHKYLEHFNNHFNTIGLVGMNECLLNFMGKPLQDKKSTEFALKVLDFMREKLSEYQEVTGELFNLEATPAEGASYRLAKIDYEEYDDIIVAGEEYPYYTNSTQLPVDFTHDIFDALDIQDQFQVKYTGGTVFHCYLGEEIKNIEACKNLVKTIASKYRLPYFTISPTFSICAEHGYITGDKDKCPKCGRDTEVYSRIVGYYRPVRNWNKGKKEEYKNRVNFDEEKESVEKIQIYYFYSPYCRNCPPITKWLNEHPKLKINKVDTTKEEGIDLANKLNVKSNPTVVIIENKTINYICSLGGLNKWYEDLH